LFIVEVIGSPSAGSPIGIQPPGTYRTLSLMLPNGHTVYHPSRASPP
jgi:hypothetical protein